MKVAIIFGSKSDIDKMKNAALCLKEFGIEYKAFILSAHRVPEYLEKTIKEIDSHYPQSKMNKPRYFILLQKKTNKQKKTIDF